MENNEPKYDYSRVGEEYEDVEWINLITRKKEWIRIPLGRSMRDTPIIPNFVSESVFNYWKQMNSCKIPEDFDHLESH